MDFNANDVGFVRASRVTTSKHGKTDLVFLACQGERVYEHFPENWHGTCP